jgi:GR25 family glycosyltransferase involved in LPS biosynthesis
MSSEILAPICLFTYNRLEETQQTIEALKLNFLAPQSELFIFSDGSKNNSSATKVENVRSYLKTITGFKKISVIESADNKGLANSVIDGVTQIINEFGKIIVLEDDLVTSKNFLDFMNQGLNFYETNQQIHSITGYTMNLNALRKSETDFYFSYRESSWGWATWKDRWQSVDWDIKDYSKFRYNIKENLRFMKGGCDLPRMLHSQMNGKIDSWAVRWCYSQFKNNQFAVFPSISKVINIGDGESATHTKIIRRYKTNLDTEEKQSFTFASQMIINYSITKEFRSKFSLYNRLVDKILKLLH